MNTKKTDFSRRSFFKLGLGAAGTLAASPSLGSICKVGTGQQPLGPFFPNEGTPQTEIRETPDVPIYFANDNDLTFVKGSSGSAKGRVVHISGQVTDENCVAIPNASIIIWQASASGRYNHIGDAANEDFTHPVTGEIIERSLDPEFQYWGKATSDAQGNYSFKTIVPGFYPADLGRKWYRPPHIHFLVSATGFPQFVTQMYFESESFEDNEWIQELNSKDLLLDNPGLTPAQRQQLIVSFTAKKSGLHGTFDLAISR